MNKCYLSTSRFFRSDLELKVYQSIRIQVLEHHTLRYDIAQSAGYSKKPLNINPFWERASAEPPLEWTKWAAIMEMAVFAKDEIKIRNLLRPKPSLTDPVEPVYEIEIQGETDAQRKNREVRNQEKREKPGRKGFYVTHTDGTKQTHGSEATFFSVWGLKATDKFSKNDLT